MEQPAGPYLLPRTPSMKRRRKDQTDQASRLAALNASLLDTSTNTRSRRAASRVRTPFYYGTYALFPDRGTSHPPHL